VSDARFLEGLRQRRLFELAENYCRDRLAQMQATDPARADLTVELIRTLGLHATNAPPEERDALWASARQVAADFALVSPPSPRAILVQLQDALTPLAQGELGRQEFDAGALSPERLEPVQKSLREATDLLESLDRALTREIPLRRRGAATSGQLSADQLFTLQLHVQHQLARAQRNRALLYGRGSDDRLALLVAAVETLERPLAQLAAGEPLKPAIELDLAECQRLLGRFEEAAALAVALDQEGIDPATRLRARSELIRVAIAQNNLAAAERLIEQGRAIDGQSAAELDFAWFEAYLALVAAADDSRQARKYQERAAKTADFLEETHGPYWGRRADQLLVANLPRTPGVASAELLSRTADSLYLKGELDQAIAAYDQASAAARQTGDPKTAFELAYKAALVEQERGDHAAAANRLRILSKSLATHEHAAQAHLLAAWNAGQAARGDKNAAATYQELLDEHLAIFPMAESSAQARVWLGKLHEANGDLPAAIEAYAGVPRTSPEYAAAIAALARCWRGHLSELAAAGEPTADPAADAIAFFRQSILDPSNQPPAKWTPADRTAALAAAELILAWRPAEAPEAERLLRAALEGSADAPPEWRTAAQAQLVVALAGQAGKHDEALAVLGEIGAASPARMLEVLEGLSQVAARSRQDSRPQIAGVQLAAIARLASIRSRLAADQQRSLDRIEAEALAAAGRRDEALSKYAGLVRQNPSDGALHRGYAGLLLASQDPADLTQALAQWRIVASRTRPRTPAWYEAKYSVAQAQYKLGDSAGAATLLKYLLETPPGLEGSEWEAAYVALLKKCED
jgi:hypothetical protein